MIRKGQTAMEYLLILVIVITVVVAVMIWMQASQRQISRQTLNNTNNILCAQTPCTGLPTDCKTPPCPSTGSCNLGTLMCQV